MAPPRPRRLAVPAVLVAVALLGAGCSGDDGASGSDARRDSGDRPSTTASTTEPGATGSEGAPGVGDPYYADAGNGGYDVEGYDVTARIRIAGADQLEVSARITATATQDLSQLDLDLLGFEVDRVRVDGDDAQFRREERELVITPADELTSGDGFEVVVDYHGAPGSADVPGSFLENGGWVDLDDYSVVIAEPVGAATWLPSNDHPSDKATYALTATVDAPLEAVANGNLVERTDDGATSTFTWRATEPMATYLMTVAVGDYDLLDQPTTAGAKILNAVPPASRGLADAAFARFPEMITFFSTAFGDYPFDAAGNIVAPGLPPLALECQTRSVFGESAIQGSTISVEAIVAHELAHQWFGDAVSPATWRDIWLNESLATYGQWMWVEHIGGPPIQQTATLAHDEDDPELAVPPADPGVDQLFGRAVYDRGAMFLSELRERMGDEKFFTLLRTWVEEHEYGTASTAEFLELAAQVAGAPVDDLAQPWLYGTPLPPLS